MAMCSGKKCSASKILFLVALPFVFWLVWFGTTSLLGKETVESSLKQLSEQVAKFGNKNNKEIKLTHGEIYIEGWGYKKSAVVRDVALEISEKSSPIPMKLLFSTENIVVTSDNLDYKRLLMTFSKPINISRNGDVGRSLNFSEPLLYYYTKNKNAGGGFQHDIVFPKHINLSKIPTTDIAGEGAVKDKHIDDYSVDFTKSPTLQIISNPEQKTYYLTYDFSGFTYVIDNQNKINVGIWKSDVNAVAEEDRVTGKYKLSIADIILNKDNTPTEPYAINIDVSYTKDLSEKSNESKFAGAVNNRDIILNEINLSNPNFKISASGKFSNMIDDPLPSGEVNISIDNSQKFLNSELVAMQGKEMIENILTKITGHSLSDQEQISILLKREKNGVFYIGKTTFEELVASLFSISIAPKNPSSSRLPDMSPVLGEQQNDAGFDNQSGGGSAPAIRKPE